MKKKVIIIGVLIIFLIFLSLYFDSEIIKVISFIRNNWINKFFLGIKFISSEVIIFFLVTILFLWKKNKREWILPLWFTIGLSAVISFLLKVIVQRQRPFQLGIISLLPNLEKASYSIWNFSFPSSHAFLAFAVLPFLSKEYPKLKYIWIIFACLIALSRVYLGLHFLSDVLVGGTMGYLLGLTIINIEEEKHFFKQIYKKIFRK
ncbi:MAG: phosphatase PAP2 family protein [Candidatus Thorarchaeota archaeon]